jgi:hypothetical protein
MQTAVAAECERACVAMPAQVLDKIAADAALDLG